MTIKLEKAEKYTKEFESLNFKEKYGINIDYSKEKSIAKSIMCLIPQFSQEAKKTDIILLHNTINLKL